MDREQIRLAESRDRKKHWKRWGPYLSERAWGTVREDYSSDGNAWEFFPHEHARSRVYRWNEDGLAGISDRHQQICFALALWNGLDPILKERLFGLTGSEGNHGEDVKEYYFYLDSTPTHSYMKYLYKYPQTAFPYTQLVEENRRRGKNAPEFELLDTGIFDDNRYFDVFVEYAKGDDEDILIKITATNRGPDRASLSILPTIWFRNTWSWGDSAPRAGMRQVPGPAIKLTHHSLGKRWLYFEGSPELLFTENETNTKRLFGVDNSHPCVKDGINDYIVHGAKDAVSPEGKGTKAAGHFRTELSGGESVTLRLRLTNIDFSGEAFDDFDGIFSAREREADEFYATVIPQELSSDAQNVMRQGFAGMLWSKQFYHYVTKPWLAGDPGNPLPPPERSKGRNKDWPHLFNADVISMPDKWEYPWYAAWDLAFHCVPLAIVDSDFAKEQLVLLLREWYMHPSGQLPAYEWAFSDVNPPVHAWAALRVYQIERKETGIGDVAFLARVFHKLLINFTWWVNRKDAEGKNVFQGGFLGLDNIGVFNRSEALPGGARLDQSDGTSWMAMFCLNMLAIALELARQDDAYEDVATKFLEHFFEIAHAMNDHPAVRGDDQGDDLWCNDDGFYYDLLHLPGRESTYLKVRSMVGLVPLLAVETIDAELLRMLPGFRTRLEWFLRNRADLVGDAASVTATGEHDRRLFAIVSAPRLRAILARMLDESEFLSPYGIRSVSRRHAEHPFRLVVDGQTVGEVDYEPAESRSGLFGGNSNWRGPIWFPLNFLIIEALQKFDWYYGDTFTVEHPAGSGRMLTLWEVSVELSRRLISIFVRHEGRRAVFGGTERLQRDPHWRDLVPFHEYFHGDDGAGLGASHQTGWTALVAKLIQQSGVPAVR